MGVDQKKKIVNKYQINKLWSLPQELLLGDTDCPEIVLFLEKDAGGNLVLKNNYFLTLS